MAVRDCQHRTTRELVPRFSHALRSRNPKSRLVAESRATLIISHIVANVQHIQHCRTRPKAESQEEASQVKEQDLRSVERSTLCAFAPFLHKVSIYLLFLRGQSHCCLVWCFSSSAWLSKVAISPLSSHHSTCILTACICIMPGTQNGQGGRRSARQSQAHGVHSLLLRGRSPNVIITRPHTVRWASRPNSRASWTSLASGRLCQGNRCLQRPPFRAASVLTRCRPGRSESESIRRDSSASWCAWRSV